MNDSGKASSHWRRNDDIEFLAQVRHLANGGVSDVGVGNLPFVHGDAEPAVLLGGAPVVHERNARRSDWMSFDLQVTGGKSRDAKLFRRLLRVRGIAANN